MFVHTFSTVMKYCAVCLHRLLCFPGGVCRNKAAYNNYKIAL